MSKPTRIVKLCRKNNVVIQDCDVYIGRKVTLGGWNLHQSKWANPFKIKECGSAENAVRKYEDFIRKQPRLLQDLYELEGKTLGCWCKPEPCHGDVLVKLINEKKSQIFRHVSICGSAGRNEDLEALNKDVFERMISKAKEYLETLGEKKEIILVSGGAAWSDHIAVKLFLTGDYGGLVLHLPCEFKNGKFEDFSTNCAKSANYYHALFSQKCCFNSLKELEQAIHKCAKIAIHKGFFARNTYIASSPYLLAFSTAPGNKPEKGGTLDTWSKCKGIKTHLRIRD